MSALSCLIPGPPKLIHLKLSPPAGTRHAYAYPLLDRALCFRRSTKTSTNGPPTTRPPPPPASSPSQPTSPPTRAETNLTCIANDNVLEEICVRHDWVRIKEWGKLLETPLDVTTCWDDNPSGFSVLARNRSVRYGGQSSNRSCTWYARKKYHISLVAI